MEQSRLESLLESFVNVLIGYGVALVSQIVVFPLVGIAVPLSTNLIIGAFFTAISLARSYVIRRWFNAGLHRVIAKTARRILRSTNDTGRI